MGEAQLFRDDGAEGPSYSTDWSESALARVVPQAGNTRLTAFIDAILQTVICTIHPSIIDAESTREAELLDRNAKNIVDWYRNAVQKYPTSARSPVESPTTRD